MQPSCSPFWDSIGSIRRRRSFRQHHRHRLKRLERRRGIAVRGGNRSLRPDRRRRRLRAERQSAAGRGIRHRAGRRPLISRRANPSTTTLRNSTSFRAAPTSPSRRRLSTCCRRSSMPTAARLVAGRSGCSPPAASPSRRRRRGDHQRLRFSARTEHRSALALDDLRAASRVRHLCQRVRAGERAGQSLWLQLRCDGRYRCTDSAHRPPGRTIQPRAASPPTGGVNVINNASPGARNRCRSRRPPARRIRASMAPCACARYGSAWIQ